MGAMQIGLCTSCSNAAVVKAAGFDFIEENVRRFLMPEQPDDSAWGWAGAAAACTLPIASANVLLPGELKIVGPSVEWHRLEQYIATVARRAAKAGIRTVVFGAGASRSVPDGFDRDLALRQLSAFLRHGGDVLGAAGITLVVEHLNRRETNLLNRLSETARLVGELAHPAVGLLLDTYHFWLEQGTADELREAVPLVRHVHVADRDGRTAPGLVTAPLDGRDYVGVFRVLRQGGYDGRVSVEAASFDLSSHAAAVARHLRAAWSAAAD